MTGSLRGPLVAMGACGLAFIAYTQAVTLGLLHGVDLEVARLAASWWRPGVGTAAAAVAVLGGPEVTAALALAMVLFLVASGRRRAAWALLALPLALALEVVYKRAIVHPAPIGFAHHDGPSLVTIFAPATLTLGGSYPSGHIMRTVLIYGCGAYLIRWLGPREGVRRAAWPAMVAMVGIMALDRIYLNVHWQSDVVGGILLGGIALAGAVTWLDALRTARW
ncbi:MAG TPA: phosphatase PAP2 family protein [Candidatus Dormibacteraeota bacterium]|nr:phosphatase PAP2 family protein [Candidatus Dormibacteraeota bacterium]